MGDLPITLFDIAVLAVVALSALMALARGFVREVLGLLSWVGAAIITWYAFPAVQPLVRQALGGDLLADLATGGGLFVVSLVVLKILGGMIGTVASRVAVLASWTGWRAWYSGWRVALRWSVPAGSS